MAQLFGGESGLKAFMLLEARACLSILPFLLIPRGKVHFLISLLTCGKVEKFYWVTG
jgi:hypothetical protein